MGGFRSVAHTFHGDEPASLPECFLFTTLLTHRPIEIRRSRAINGGC